MLKVFIATYHAIAGIIAGAIGTIFVKIGLKLTACAIGHKETLEKINN